MRNPYARVVRGIRNHVIPSGKEYRRNKLGDKMEVSLENVRNLRSEIFTEAFDRIRRDYPDIADILRNGDGYIASFWGNDLAWYGDLIDGHETTGARATFGFRWSHPAVGLVRTVFFESPSVTVNSELLGRQSHLSRSLPVTN